MPRMTEKAYAELLCKYPRLREADRLARQKVKTVKEFIPVVGDEKKLLEDAIQAAYFEFCLHPDNLLLMPELDCIYAVPNAAKRSKLNGWIMKLTGTREGVPDVHIPVSRKPFFSFYIEFKTWKAFNSKNHGCSPAQLAWHEKLRKQGHRVEIYWSVSEAIRLTKEYLGYV